MSTLTSPDNIVVWTTADPSSIVAESAAQATSIQAALSARQAATYRVADSTALTALGTVPVNSEAYQIDTDTVYRYNLAGQWKIWARPRTAVAITITGWASATVPPTTTAFVTVVNGIGFLEVKSILGTGTITVANILVTMPYTMSTATFGTNSQMNGAVAFRDVSATANFMGVVLFADANTLRLYRVAAAGEGQVAAVSSTSPFTFATTDEFSLSVMFPIA